MNEKNEKLALEFNSFPDGFYFLTFEIDYYFLEITFSKIGYYWVMISKMHVEGELLNLYGKKITSLELINQGLVQIEYKGIDSNDSKNSRIYYIKVN